MTDTDPVYTNNDIQYIYDSQKTLSRKLFFIFSLITYIIVLVPIFLLIMIVNIFGEKLENEL